MRVVRLAAVLLVAAGLPAPGPAQAGVPTCQGRPATILGTQAADVLEGTAKADVVVALGGDDVVRSRGGDDLVCGGPGADVLEGGPGHDSLHGGIDRYGQDAAGPHLIGDVLRGGDGDDRLVGGYDTRAPAHRRPDTVSWSDAPGGVVVDLSGETGVATGSGTDSITLAPHIGVQGSPYADTITGSDGHDRVDGLDGGDRIVTGPGNDTVYADVLNGGSGHDSVATGKGDDLVGSYAGRDDLGTGAGRDFVEAYSPLPTVVAVGPGDDYVAQNVAAVSGMGSAGGLGVDRISLYGTPVEGGETWRQLTIDLRTGTTSVDVEPAATGTIGGFEEHRLIGNLRWRFHGSPARDRVWAITGGPLVAWTYAGDDWVRGSPRDDVINGGRDVDEAIGGEGTDLCRNVERGTC